MKAARIVVLAVALAAGGAAAFLVAGDDEKKPEPAPAHVAQLPTVDVLIAKGDIGMGTAVSEQDFLWQAWPARQLGTLSLALRSLLDASTTGEVDEGGRKSDVNTVRYGVSVNK